MGLVALFRGRYCSNMSSTAGVMDRVSGLLADLADLGEPPVGLGAGCGEQLLALRRLTDRVQALGLRWLAAFDAAGAAAVDGSGSTASWLATHSHCSRRAAAADVALARRLHTDPVRPLAAVETAVAAGTITVDHARALARATATMNPAAFELIEATIAAAACRLEAAAAGELAAAARVHAESLVAAATDDPLAARTEAARTRRHLHVSPCGDLVAVDGLLDATDGAALIAALAPLAAPVTDPDGGVDPRSAAQRRADALGELARRQLAAADLPATGGQRPQLSVVIGLADLIDQTGAARLTATSPSTQVAVGAEAARRIGCDATVGWALTDTPTAGLTDTGATDLIDRALLTRLLSQLPPALGGLPLAVLAAGRHQRLVTTAQRQALTLRDGGACSPAATARHPGAKRTT